MKRRMREADGAQAAAGSAERLEVARGNMYRFLSAAYLQPPNQDLMRHLADTSLLEHLSALFGEGAAADLKEFAAALSAEDVAALKQEYMGLFAVPTGRFVTPFEDVYRGKTSENPQERGPLLGLRAIAARRMYREAGAAMDRDCKELPTHIGVELSFMSFLCERRAEAIRNEESGILPDEQAEGAADSFTYRNLQLRFLQEHLNGWFPPLSKCIQAYARSPFYRGLAGLTEAFLAWDTAGLLAESRPAECIGMGEAPQVLRVANGGH